MKAMIYAAGLGTRLKPWTDRHPKALAEVGGVPMLERVILGLKGFGVDRFVINVHHFASQVVDFIESKEFGVEILISDESDCLLDTGGGLVRAKGLLDFASGPVVLHNADILSNADISCLAESQLHSSNHGLLLVSDRESTRKLIFDTEMNLRGWHDLRADAYRPNGFEASAFDREYAFSGIHVVDGEMVEEMENLFGNRKFPIMDYDLSESRRCKVGGHFQRNLELIDIGKPESLAWAEALFGQPES